MRQPEHPPSLPRRLEENHDLRLGCERSDVQPGDGRQAVEGGKLRKQDAGAAGFRLLPLKSLLGLGLVLFAGGALFVYPGAFDAAANTPHSGLVF
jgi:hypothetical protein